MSEIKNCKKQIFLRDEDIARLTSQVNDLDSQFSQILEENAALKFNSGIEYVDLVPLRDVRELRIHDLTLERDMLAKMIGTFESDVVDQKGKLCLLSHRDIDVIPLIKDLEENREFENRYLNILSPCIFTHVSIVITRHHLSILTSVNFYCAEYYVLVSYN